MQAKMLEFVDLLQFLCLMALRLGLGALPAPALLHPFGDIRDHPIYALRLCGLVVRGPRAQDDVPDSMGVPYEMNHLARRPEVWRLRAWARCRHSHLRGAQDTVGTVP